MSFDDTGSGPREIATFIAPAAVGIGLGVFLGLALADSAVLAGLLAIVGAIAGHGVGYLILRR